MTTTVADAIRTVTTAMQRELESGRRARSLDAHDLIDALLAIADAIDPPFAPTPRDERPRRKRRRSR